MIRVLDESVWRAVAKRSAYRIADLPGMKADITAVEEIIYEEVRKA